MPLLDTLDRIPKKEKQTKTTFKFVFKHIYFGMTWSQKEKIHEIVPQSTPILESNLSWTMVFREYKQ